MTTAPAATLTPLDERRPLLTPWGWAGVALITTLFLLVHGTFVEWLFRVVTNARGQTLWQVLGSAISQSWNADWSHIIVVPFISVFCVYLKREELAATPRRICFWGLPILLVGLFSYVFWLSPGRNNMLQGYSMILGLFGLVLFLLGPGMMRYLWFPILYLVLAVKVSDRWWEAIAFRLQDIASVGAGISLQFFTLLFDFEITRRGSNLDLTYMQGGVPVTNTLNVAEACSGLRSLMAFVALGVALAFLWERAWWHRTIMILMAVPIAVAVNIGRVTALGLLYLVNEEYAKGDFHTMIGMFMLVPAALLFLLLGWVLDKVVIKDEKVVEAERRARAAELEAGRAAVERERLEAPAVSVEKTVQAGIIAAVAGAGIALVAGSVYLLMLMMGSPSLGIRGVLGLAMNTGLRMSVLLIPGALIATGLAYLTWRGLGSMRQRGAHPHGIAVAMIAGLLTTVFAGHSVATTISGEIFIKLPVPLRHSLILIPDQIGTWKGEDEPPLPPEIIEALGTDRYLSRIYEDHGWPEGQPGRFARLHVAYYTGTMDTVPHVPDRCFVAGGIAGEATGLRTIRVTGDYVPDPVHGGYKHPVIARQGSGLFPFARVPQTEFETTYFTFRDPRSQRRENVLYFFVANGKFLPTPDHVRASGFDPRDRYSYYCKIEVQLFGVSDLDLASQRAESLLSAVLPEIMACLPDWVEVTEGRWPPEAASGSRSARQESNNADTAR
jgi:exosortase